MSKPTIRELLDLYPSAGKSADLAERVEAVLGLHSKRGRYCRQCSQGYDEGGIEWPCPTRRALDGLGEGK